MKQVLYNFILILSLSAPSLMTQAQEIIQENNDFILMLEDGSSDLVFKHTSGSSLDILDYIIKDSLNLSIALLDKSNDLHNSTLWIIVCRKNESNEWKYDWSICPTLSLGNYMKRGDIKDCVRFISSYEFSSICDFHQSKINLLKLNGSRLTGIFNTK